MLPLILLDTLLHRYFIYIVALMYQCVCVCGKLQQMYQWSSDILPGSKRQRTIIIFNFLKFSIPYWLNRSIWWKMKPKPFSMWQCSHCMAWQMLITGYATSGSCSTAWTQLIDPGCWKELLKCCVLHMLVHNLLCNVNDTRALVGLCLLVMSHWH